MVKMKDKEWFTEWFNTPYYHTLYKDRDSEDARLFMKNLTQSLNLLQDSHILDLPCGKGRHSVYLNSLGFKVTGGDLSEKSISYAKQFENDRLKFIIHDMRLPFQSKYNAVFNLFTSYGYFESDKTDLIVLQNIKNGLKKDGVFVFDFFNADQLRKSLITNETKQIDGINFKIKREINNGFIYKKIDFYADGLNHNYTERVKFLDLKKMQSYFDEVGFEIINCFGDYNLNEYDSKSSDRLILIAK